MHDHDRDIRAPWEISCEQLCVARGGRAVLPGLDAAFRSGECVSLIGPNGSGKTTLMLALLGLLPPASGRVRVNERDVGGLSARARGRFASYVPQTVERLPGFSVYDVVASGRYPHTSPMRPLTKEDREHIARALEFCGLSELADRRINAISGGERQKTLIAAAIAQDAQVMCLDEPNTALDPAYQIDLVRLLKRWSESGRALVLISHDLNLPTALGGRVVALRDGRIVADGEVEEIVQPQRLAEIYGARFEIARTPDGAQVVVPKWNEPGGLR